MSKKRVLFPPPLSTRAAWFVQDHPLLAILIAGIASLPFQIGGAYVGAVYLSPLIN